MLTAAIASGVWLWQSSRGTGLETKRDQPAATVPPPVIETAQPPQPEAGEHPLVRLARRSPAEAWRAATALPQSRFRKSLRRFIAALWVERDPKGAMDTFEGMDEERVPAGWMFELLARWMAVDEEAAADWALATPAGRPQRLMAGAIDWMLDHSKPREATVAAAERMLRRWARREPEAAWSVASADGLASARTLLRSVAEVWIESDPYTALEAAIAHSQGLVADRAWVADLAAEWARAAPREVADWVLALPPPSRWKLLLAAVHAPLSVEAPEEALTFAREFEAEMSAAYHEPLYGRQLQALLGDDPRVLADWLASQPDESLRMIQTARVATLYIATHPDEVLQWALGLPEKESARALRVIVRATAEQDPGDAKDIVLNVVDPVRQVGAARSFVAHWAADLGQPDAAHRWVTEKLSRSVRLEVNRDLFPLWAARDAAGAVSAARQIADADERLAAKTAALQGLLLGPDGDDTPERLHTRMLAFDELYQEIVTHSQPHLDYGGFASHTLYQYWKDVDPGRAYKYEAMAKRYEEEMAERHGTLALGTSTGRHRER